MAQELGRDLIWGLGSDISAGFQRQVLIPSRVRRGVGISPPSLPPAAGFGGEGPAKAEPLIGGTAATPHVSPNSSFALHYFCLPLLPLSVSAAW